VAIPLAKLEKEAPGNDSTETTEKKYRRRTERLLKNCCEAMSLCARTFTVVVKTGEALVPHPDGRNRVDL
jgi:hypothetical protein